MHAQGIAGQLDQKTQIVLKRQASEQIFGDVPRVVACDFEDDEVERVGFGGIDQVQKFLG
jgi:hypothetical protein